jgi:hypothetical protein
MMLPFTDGLVRTTHFDGEMSLLADRHYSRRTVGARQFCYSGRKLVLRNTAGTVLFAWVWPDPKYRMDKLDGFHCMIFRNESSRLSSEIILEAESWAVRHWGLQPVFTRFYTYVDPRKIRSVNPGACFIKAGWKRIGTSKTGKVLLEKAVRNDLLQESWSGKVTADVKKDEVTAGSDGAKVTADSSNSG